MKNIYLFQTGILQVNTWLIPEAQELTSENPNSWYIVDPGDNAFDIIAWFRDKKKKPLGIFITHGHFDHVGAVPAIKNVWIDIPIYIHQGDKIAVGKGSRDFHVNMAKLMGLTEFSYTLCEDLPKALFIEEGSEISGWEILYTPGHTQGSVCLYSKENGVLISGDTLFCGGQGRTDFPGGNFEQMQVSLKRLSTLPKETLVLPGHGSITKIAEEFL